MKRFTVTAAGPDRFGLAKLAQEYIDGQWLAAHMFPEEAAEAMREQFRRAIMAEIELLDVRCVEAKA